MANLSNINNKFLVTTGGNVLIGQTADAGKKLYVYNTASADVALLESTQVFSTLAFKSSTNASTVTIGIDGAGNAAFENKLAAGKITFVTNGAERMQIDSSGNTTITTISNQGGLTARSSQDNVIIGIDNTATGGLPWRLQSTGGSSGLGAGKLFLKVGGTETDTNLISFITDSSGNNIKMGVGITGPTAKLHIFERTANTAVGLKLQSYSWDASLSLINDQGTWEILNDRTGLGTNATLAFYNGGYKMALTPAGNLGIGTTSPRAVGSGYKGLEVSSPSSGSSLWLSGFSDTTKGYLAMDTGGLNLTAITNHSLTFGTNNSPKMVILSGGNVGIGTTAINGSFGASNTILAVKGKTSGGEGIIQISGLGNNATDNVGRLSFHSYNETNPLVEIRAVRGNSDTVGRLEEYTANVKRSRLDENGAFEYQGAEAGVTGVRFQGSGTCNGYSGSLASFYVMDVMRDQGSQKSMNVQGTIDIAAGYGIGFGASAGSGATNTLLDDYEEGTFTPQAYYQNTTDQGNTTDNTTIGQYVKIGATVTVWIKLNWTITGSPAVDNVGIKNLPFQGTTTATGASIAVFIKNVSAPILQRIPTNSQTLTLFMGTDYNGNYGNQIGAGTHEIATSFTYLTGQ